MEDCVVFSNKDLKHKTGWACLSNYFIRETFVNGYPYATMAHYFNAQKFESKEYKAEIRAARSGLQAKKLGAAERDDVVPKWEEEKMDIMKRGLTAKFGQHNDLQAVLMATKQADIIFQSSTDSFWGNGKDKKGENTLGKLLVEIREEFRIGQIRVAMQCHGVNFN